MVLGHDGRAAEHAPSQRRRVQVNARRTRRTEPSSGRRRRRRRGRRRTPTRTTDRIASPAAYLKLLAQPCVNEQPTSNRLFPSRPVDADADETDASTRRRRRAPHTPTRTAPALAHRTSCPLHRTLSRTHHRNHRNHRPRPRRRRRRRRRNTASQKKSGEAVRLERELEGRLVRNISDSLPRDSS